MIPSATAGLRVERPIAIRVGDAVLPGLLSAPDGASGIVLFAHGSGSSRLSPRNRLVAEALERAGFATLLFDLLTEREDRNPALRFAIPLLADRLVAATHNLAFLPEVATLPRAYFGASTGAAAALVATTMCPVAAVVSRGGRPDLAGADTLHRVSAPTLLIVGSADAEVLALNRAARAELRCETSLAIVRGATHLFTESGALDEVARLAVAWLQHWLAVPRMATSAPA